MRFELYKIMAPEFVDSFIQGNLYMNTLDYFRSIENNKATIEKLTTESTFKYSYELSDEKAKLLLYVNDKEVTEFNNIKNDIADGHQ